MSDWRWMLCPACEDLARYKRSVVEGVEAGDTRIVCTGGHDSSPELHAPTARVPSAAPPEKEYLDDD